LIAIADALGHGVEARAAALRSFNAGLEPNRNVTALADVKILFEMAGWPEQLASREIVARLRGGKGTFEGDYRAVTAESFAALMVPLGIRPRQLWPSPRLPSSKSFRGYRRGVFERPWSLYLDDPLHAPQASNVRHLRDA
jgi:hypothetical protein